MKLKLGDKVAYSAAFLKSIGAITGELPQLRGEVIELTTIGKGGPEVAKLRDADGYEWSSLVANLAIVGPNSRFCQC
jgi:hypothetical protein